MGDTCDACRREVPIAGGIANFWTMDHTETGGLTLEFESDGTEHFLCFDCIAALPDDPTAADVAALRTER
ncbi:MAG: hypothetical protein ABEJ70_05885 [Halobacteriaceae archaeon]